MRNIDKYRIAACGEHNVWHLDNIDILRTRVLSVCYKPKEGYVCVVGKYGETSIDKLQRAALNAESVGLPAFIVTDERNRERLENITFLAFLGHICVREDGSCYISQERARSMNVRDIDKFVRDCSKDEREWLVNCVIKKKIDKRLDSIAWHLRNSISVHKLNETITYLWQNRCLRAGVIK